MRILLVDDHPMTLEGYKSALVNGFFEHIPQFTTANNCRDAYREVGLMAAEQQEFQLAIVDYGLPAYTEKGIENGGDMAMAIRKIMPDCRIIMITAHTEIIIIYDIAKKIRPNGLIIKNDVTPENLKAVVKTVLDGNEYQSPMVKNSINEIWKKQLMIDDNNRQILLYLSKGFKIRELDQIIHLTNSTIQKRIILMKKAFEVSDDSGLIKAAIRHGFL